ncbi:MAG: hypothetical protein ACYC06_01335 [Ilumatobacteraceae bacterium]
MFTTYAMSLNSKRWSAVTRISLVDAVSDWLAEAYPYDTRPTTTTVRVREGVDDPVFRVEISESDKRNQAIHQTIITVAVLDMSLVFEVRIMLRPTGQSVLPRPRFSTPNMRLTELCQKIANELKVRDAEQLINGEIRITSQTVDGEALAAFAEAPGRRLPIVIEHTQGRIPIAHATASLGTTLIGIAHVFHIATNEAVTAFNEFRRERLLTPDAITIIWPAPHPPTQIYDKDVQRVLAPLIEAAAASMQPVMVPQMQRSQSVPAVAIPLAPRPISDPGLVPQQVAPIPNPQIAVLEVDNAQLRNQVDDLIRTQDELMENIAGTDLLNAALVDERDRYLDQMTALLSFQSSANWPRTPREAVARAWKMCPNLVFHERTTSSSDDVQTQNGKRILESLIELNNIASRLKDGRIPLHMFEIHCRDRLNFAADVSDTAKHRFSDDYAIAWHGETVYATPHIRCGDIRIHFYLDRVRLQVVIAYVGRHLRDKSTN